MANLSTIVNARLSSGGGETNLEKGQIYYYNLGNPSGNYSTYQKCPCFIAPASGTVTIEIWGAGGSSGKMCCCGFAMPGNPGAYSKKTLAVQNGDTITMNIGAPCRNDTLCYKGISESTCICYSTSGGSVAGTMCAGGGDGGYAFCVDGASAYCCARNCGFPGQLFADIGGAYSGGSAGCGLICNYCSNRVPAATGGDINLNGGFSCVAIGHCNTCCQCHFYAIQATPPGYGSECGGFFSYTNWCGGGTDRPSGTGMKNAIAALNAISRTPNRGNPFNVCWGAGMMCGCYECTPSQIFMPHGVGGAMAWPCSSVRHHGFTGGSGAVRIQFN